MSCNRDSSCLSIANTKYPSEKEEINIEFNNIKKDLIELKNALKDLNIPDDHIGEKIIEKLDKIYQSLEEDTNEVEKANSDLNQFINVKIKEHKNHYYTWKQSQEKSENVSLDGGEQ